MEAMIPTPVPSQSFSRVVEGQRRIWATTPLLWLMSLWFQTHKYDTSNYSYFKFVETATLVPHATAHQARTPTTLTWTREDLAVPVVLVQVPPQGATSPKTVLVDGIHRVRKLDSLGIPEIEVMVVPEEVARQFEVPHADVAQACAQLQLGQTHPALQAVYDAARADLLPQVNSLRDQARQNGMALPDLPLPQTLLGRYSQL